MTNENVLDIVRRCDLASGEELVPGEAYLFNQKFRVDVSGKAHFEHIEIIVLVKNRIKVGGIYRMGPYDIHCIIDERYRGQHIMSNFLKKGVIQQVWPENKSVELCEVYTQDEYDKKRYLAGLCGQEIKNKEKIERFLAYCRQQQS